MIKLMVVVEIMPWEYELSNDDLMQNPKGTISLNNNAHKMPKTTPHLIDTYFADSYFTDIVPLKNESWLVDINSFSDDDLKLVVQYHLKDVDISDIEDTTSTLCGGIAVLEEGRVVIEPQCCSQLLAITDWASLRQLNSEQQKQLEDWQFFWIGHPWLYCKMTQDSILFSDYIDTESDENLDIRAKHTFAKEVLIEQIDKCIADQQHFKNRIKNILLDLEISEANAIEIANIMSGVEDDF